MSALERELRECPECGLLQRLESPSGRAVSCCARCGAHLRRHEPASVALSFSIAGLGLCLISLGLALPMATVSMSGGRFATASLLKGPAMLREGGTVLLSGVVMLTLLILPIAKFATVGATALGIWRGRVPGWLRRAFAESQVLSGWSMVDVYLLGAVIALVRLGGWMAVDLGPAFVAWVGVALCELALERAVDPPVFWHAMPAARARPPAPGPSSACRACAALATAGSPCPRCGARVVARKRGSSERTWALVVAAALLAIPANTLPVMTISQAGSGGPKTILGGTAELVEHGFWGLAVLVFVASILVPLAKLLVLSALLVATRRRLTTHLVLRARLFRFVAIIGRWSMLDIFATMTLVAMARFGWVGSVVPGAGATAFCAVVIVTMLAVETFDPREMWDAAGLNRKDLEVVWASPDLAGEST